MNQTQNVDSATSMASEVMSWVNSTSGLELSVGFTVPANESNMGNVTDETVWSSHCGTVMMEYGIIACIICGIAFVVGVVFCMFGE